MQELLEKMEAQGDAAFDPRDMMKMAVGKLMMTLTYGFGSEEGLINIAGITVAAYHFTSRRFLS